jgi:2-methylcitrate dehydratase PrpD
VSSRSAEKTSGIAHYLACLIGQMGSTPFSEKDRAVVRQHVLDAIAAAFIGRRSHAFHDLTKLCARVSDGCAWPGSGLERVHPIDGAMLWAFAINASVYEDGSREGACHPAAAIIPTVLALSKERSWDALDRAVVAGYDVMVRLARSGNPEFTKKGFHPTAITAPFGAAATASFVLRYDSDTTQDAICLAALGCAGLMSSFRSGETQPLQVAWSVRSGLVAAMMAGTGHSGYSQILEEGFYPAYLGKAPNPPIERPLGYEYAIKGSYLKTYPGCRHVHPSIDALAEILKEHQINPSRIKKIQVRTYKIAVETEIHSLNERGDAYFSIPYALAARLVLGRNDWDAFDEKHFSNQQLIAIMKKVRVDVDSELESRYPNQRGSIVEVDIGERSLLRGKVDHPLGEPENPVPFSVTIDKFRQAAGSFLSKKSMDRVEKILDVRITDSAETVFEVLSENNKGR